ncbi:3-methyladenine DNA glycosylase AlkC [Alkalihalobacillus xiaoxiensis]|uniref:3-methyladenine DNA glycosylase AlkC n=1 Tax=Shouchella xiaoxiensis TaxID=766895 RepID=A0ABS2STH6_9BACI|nr:DNA alkylation repair protein [Shouchella xiaoxiensis]MBM7838834.1 3-methyladenine DNA glycosylase AlkC [Shouchella xiaoxiensis]
MAEPLKEMYNPHVLQQFAEKVKLVYAPFEIDSFLSTIFDSSWDGLSLKQRMRKITVALGEHLPTDYPKALDVLLTLGNEAQKGLFVVFPDFIEVYGQEESDWDLSMKGLEYFTQGSSAEFAVRPFILSQPERMMAQMKEWAVSDNEHVRRLASEGCRPRLPWGQALVLFKQDPIPVLDVLELLKQDSSLYVRKSVANNLNDISKDHPMLVLETAKDWKNQHAHTDWIIRHGCRGLLRMEKPEAYALFGYANVVEEKQLITNGELAIEPSVISIGESTTLSWGLTINEQTDKRIRVEYAVDYIKANGKQSRKKFLLVDHHFSKPERINRSRTIHWANLSTRTHYPGMHQISLIVNGVSIAETSIELTNETSHSL